MAHSRWPYSSLQQTCQLFLLLDDDAPATDVL
jgi:hypothetical protein